MTATDATEREAAGKETENSGKDGVIAPALRDVSSGRWLPGVSGNPGGRVRPREKAIVTAIMDSVQPETVGFVLNDLLHDERSWRARATGVELFLRFMVGPAPTRTQERENTIDLILAKLRQGSNDMG